MSAWEVLKKEAIPDLKLLTDLAGRISFTCTKGKGTSSIGVVLYSDSFYISKATSPEHWPDTLRDLKALTCYSLYVLLELHIYPPTICAYVMRVCCNLLCAD